MYSLLFILCIFFNINIEKRKNLEEELKEAITERDRNKMTNHHFEQELRRIQTIIDCMIELNPNQIKHIQKIQSDFRYKNRNIVLSKEPSVEERNASIIAKAERKALNEKQDQEEKEAGLFSGNSTRNTTGKRKR